MATVSLQGLHKSFGSTEVIKDINIEVKDREFVALVGPSGCGKSTLLRMIAGLETTTSGDISIGDKVVNEVMPSDRKVAMVFQSYALYPSMNVRENMIFGLKQAKTSKEKIEQQLEKVSKFDMNSKTCKQANAHKDWFMNGEWSLWCLTNDGSRTNPFNSKERAFYQDSDPPTILGRTNCNWKEKASLFVCYSKWGSGSNEYETTEISEP